ncbi:hypothetical protein CCACVL1_26664 [Corchorus capsularis]|uniref:Uncharacterized protein n=1 Tax=Corchorus capsularis TaxID=210143 RepID=A0A1R3GDW7_COCAP|nr:hypothetical protein CCACVL1_26664 [Corchorus capsularis]
MAMEKVYEELDEVKIENEKLRADFKSKAELCEQLKKIQNEQLTKIKEASSKIEKQAQELLEKEEETSVLKQENQDLKSSLIEKESIIKHLNAANDKLRAERDEKSKNWEQESNRLVLALDEANEKNIDLEQTINVLRAEIEGLKAHLSVSKKKCSQAERKATNPKELRERDDLLDKVEEDKRKVADQLKWKKEQFKHLEEAHEKLKDEFKTSKKEWEKEKSTLLDDICSLQTKLDSQIRITGDLQNRLQLCNQTLAHEETRRKYLEVEVAEFKTRFENTFAECQDAKSQLDSLNSKRDNEVATLRHLLGTKESFYKEIEYRAGKLEKENQELMTSLKELQEARIQEAGSSSSLSKLKNRLKSVEQMHKESSANLRAKEAEWNSQREEMTRKLNDYGSQLESKDAALKALEMELESCLSSAVQLKLQNEEMSVIILQITREQIKILEDLRGEIELLEEESLKRELEGAAFAHIAAEKEFEHEKENLLQLVNEKDQRIDGLLQVVRSMEEKFNGSLNSFSSELAEKQAQINLVHEAWEKIARAEILAELEIEEKKLMIVELEDDIHSIQEKLLSQEKSLSDTKERALNVEAELEAKRLEMKILADQMDARLKTSEALVDELKSEKTNLVEDIMKLSMERENLLGFIGGLGDRISEFSAEEAQLMGILGRIVQSFDDNDTSDLKENKNSSLPSPATKRPDSITEERPPFRLLN